MQSDHFERALQAFLSRQPFRPFAITLKGGSRIEVDQPDVIARRNGLVVHLSPELVTSYFDHESVVALVGGGLDSDTPTVVERAEKAT